MVLTMYVAVEDSPETDERILGIAVEQSLLAAQLGYNPWFTEHHFRGSWHSNPIQFASYIAPQVPKDTYLGFGVLSMPYYHPVRLVESMNQLDQLTKGHTLYGLGSGFAGIEPPGLGIDVEYHRTGRAAEDMVEIMQRLWDFRTGDPDYVFETPTYRGSIKRRVSPAPYHKHHPTVIRTASRDSSVVKAAQKGLAGVSRQLLGGIVARESDARFTAKHSSPRNIRAKSSRNACVGAPSIGSPSSWPRPMQKRKDAPSWRRPSISRCAKPITIATVRSSVRPSRAGQAKAMLRLTRRAATWRI